jgi:hypothetical protein
LDNVTWESYILDLINRYRNKGILIDTNLLLLYLVGSYDLSWIEKFKPTKSHFEKRDYYLLVQFLQPFKIIVTTPNILTEVSNHSENKLPPEYYSTFASWVSGSNEHYMQSKDICSHKHFQKFGLTDCGIATLAQNKYLVITVDFPFYGYLQGIGVDVINYNQLRPLGWKK